MALCSAAGLQDPLGMTNPLHIPGKCDSPDTKAVSRLTSLYIAL